MLVLLKKVTYQMRDHHDPSFVCEKYLLMFNLL